MEKKVIEVSWVSLWRILLFALFVAALYIGREIVLGLFLALVISSGLEVAVSFLERKGLPRTFGVILVFLVCLFLLSLVVYTVIPFAIVDLNSMFANLGKTASNSWWGSVITPETSQSLSDVANRFSQMLFSGDVSPLALFSRALGGVALGVAVLVSSFYLSLSKDGVERFIKVVLPPAYEEAVLRIYQRSRRKIGYWFRTQIFLSVLMAILVWGALLLLGVRHAFLIGVLAGLLELVPFAGPIIAGAIAVLSAFITSPSLAFYTLLVFIAIHQFEAHVLVPLVMNKTVGLHPVIVIAAILIGAEVAGFWGVLIAVPAAAVFQEIIEDWSLVRKGKATVV
ncbi:MAG: AI-2E family transporter [Candidatus Liptonbacteria bacterium]|nr:AI-2E family transporter [Candidatus Liptonbacteria bacterium]